MFQSNTKNFCNFAKVHQGLMQFYCGIFYTMTEALLKENANIAVKTANLFHSNTGITDFAVNSAQTNSTPPDVLKQSKIVMELEEHYSTLI